MYNLILLSNLFLHKKYFIPKKVNKQYRLKKLHFIQMLYTLQYYIVGMTDIGDIYNTVNIVDQGWIFVFIIYSRNREE